MEQTITLTISNQWVQGRELDQDQLRHVLQLGLAQLSREQAAVHNVAPVGTLYSRKVMLVLPLIG